jgi:hypothetical protein
VNKGPAHSRRVDKATGSEVTISTMGRERVRDHGGWDERMRFPRAVGLRPVLDGPEVSIFELRGGTQLLLMRADEVSPGDAPFDLMVDDLRATHERLVSLGLQPSPIEARPAIDHELFTVREPAGHVITYFSSPTSGRPT